MATHKNRKPKSKPKNRSVGGKGRHGVKSITRRTQPAKKRGKRRAATPPAMGERRAIGGILPQYEAFARFAYGAILANELKWIKIADPHAGKLDDIQYATANEVRAYQVKWSSKSKPTPFKFSEFKELLPAFVSAWKAINQTNKGTGKKVLVNLLTNRPISKSDSIRTGRKKIGSFCSFHQELWMPLTTNGSVSAKWKKVFATLLSTSGLKEKEFISFAKDCILTFNYSPTEQNIDLHHAATKEFDLDEFVKFLFKTVATSGSPVQFTLDQLIVALRWERRINTTFNHELIVDKAAYQPITRTLNKLSKAVEQLKGGYIFLLGGPGTGKSTLLTQWLKGRNGLIARYYVFDFTNPTSNQNYSERGDTVSMLFDLVIQLRRQNVFEEKVLPHKDLTYLKSVFDRQLEILGARYKSEGIHTFLLIDGLDHINREYKNVTRNLIADLPHPNSLPEGVYIIMGSQRFDFTELSVDIRSDLESSHRKIIIDSFTKDEVYKYLDLVGLSLKSNQKKVIFQLSQGHPLYLSYLVNRLKIASDFNAATTNMIRIEGDINIYYKKIWEPIASDQDLIHFLGLVASMQGSIRLDFIREWNFDISVLRKFRERARFLFSGEHEEINFFHNSFRQFLLAAASIDDVSGNYDENKIKNYHNRLAELYKISKVEKSWPFAYHFFSAGNYDAFLKDAAPLILLDQLYEYRSVVKIREDLQRGVAIGKQRKDVNILISYLFALSELQTRVRYLDPASFVDQLFELRKIREIKGYLRDENTLLCSASFTLDAVLGLMAFGETTEAKLLFSLAEPDGVLESKVEFDETRNTDEKLTELEKWFFVATSFYEHNILFEKIKNLKIIQSQPHSRLDENNVKLRLLTQLAFGLIDLHKGKEVVDLLNKMNLRIKASRPYFFAILRNVLDVCIDKKWTEDGLFFLKYLFRRIPYRRMTNEEKIIVADLRFKVSGDVAQLKDDLQETSQPPSPPYERLTYNLNLDLFHYRIKLTKLLNIAGIGVPSHQAVPSKNVKDETLINFERKLCLIAELEADGIRAQPSFGNLMARIQPIIEFYYTDHRPNTHRLSFEKARGQFFEYLIQSVSLFGTNKLKVVGDGLIEHFTTYKSFWSPKDKRDVIVFLATNGYPLEPLKNLLEGVELTMLNAQSDVSGRVNECFRQVKAWIDLKDFPKAEQMIKAAIRESMGVGYRKDYQISIWIDWLTKVNRDRPEFAMKRIQWILARLHHVRATTELGPFLSAAKATLRATFEMDFSNGVGQLVWQLKNGVIHFEEGFSVYLKASLDQKLSEEEIAMLVNFYTEAFLYFATDESTDILRKIISKAYHEFDRNFFKDILGKLDSGIRISSLEETRHDLISEMQKTLKKLGVNQDEIILDFSVPPSRRTDHEASSGNELALRPNYRRVREEDVFTLTTTFDSLLELVKNEDSANSYFHWDNVLNTIGKNFSLSQLQILASAYVGRNGSFYFAPLSKLALELGDRPLAEDLAIKAIECSSMTGWMVHYDGGSRVVSFEAFAKIDKTKARHLAFDMFSDDVVRNDYSSSWIEGLDDVIPVLSDGYGLADGWPIVQNYLDRLFVNTDPAGNLPSAEVRQLGWSDSITELLVSLARYPHPVIHERAVKLLANFLAGMKPEACDFLHDLFNGDDADRNLFMRVIMGLHITAADRSRSFTIELRDLATSGNFFFRVNARKILTDNDPTQKFATSSRPLPVVYSLMLDKVGRDINETREYFGSYARFAKLLANDTGLNFQNILHRWEQLIGNSNKTGMSDSEIDNQHLEYYESIGIKYPGRKSKYTRINEALSVMIVELLDAGVLEYEQALRYIPLYDSFYCKVQPVQRPSFIHGLEKNKNYLSDDWANSVDTSERLSEKLTIDSGKVIIAEYTQMKNAGWGIPTEIFMSQLSAREQRDDAFFIFQAFNNITTDKYFSAAVVDGNIVIMRDHNPFQNGVIHSWLALNPEIGRQLGWIPDQGKMLAWKDLHGATMVESIFWADGNPQTRPPHHDSEVGEGWYVVASDAAFRQLSGFKRKLYLEKRLVRISDYNGDHKENSADIFLSTDEIK